MNTPTAQALAYTAAVEGVVLLKNTGVLPFSSKMRNIALIGPLFNATTQMQGNYEGRAPFLISPLRAFQSAGFNISFSVGTTITSDVVSGIQDALSVVSDADAVVYVGGIDNDIEAEGKDRMSITWPDNQLRLISQLGTTGKPLVVVQMGGGQLDGSSLTVDKSVRCVQLSSLAPLR